MAKLSTPNAFNIHLYSACMPLFGAGNIQGVLAPRLVWRVALKPLSSMQALRLLSELTSVAGGHFRV